MTICTKDLGKLFTVFTIMIKPILTGAISRLLKDKSLRERLAENGRKRALDFAAEKIVAQYEKYFQSV